ncbi:uncharacterized protein SCHCODRAFT_01039108, partial [Schizophyllum commune H4-8]|uniref:uncharacterized protein n=1 Tax=Schizophyllum commune (strain H4-8 / FGSC 9210) TaxID=578458 RepID=UPI00215FA34B
MSEPELAYMMTDSNDGFDLPRWQSDIDPLSSSAQAAHAAQASYLYSPGGAQQPQQQLSATSPQRLHASPPSSSSRQPPRISQIMEQGQPMYLGQGLGQGQLSRSASLGASAHRAPRRHHQPDDLEGAFHGDGQGMGTQRQQMQGSQNAFYPPAIGYPAQSSLTAPNSAVNTPLAPPEAYGDMYYAGGNAPPKSAPDPGAASNSSPYSPAGPYAYPSQPDQRQGYHSHSRTHSSVNVKREPMTPPVASPYSPQNPTQKSSGVYSPAGYSMETTSPAPGMQSALGVHTPIKQSLSSPTTPLSFM